MHINPTNFRSRCSRSAFSNPTKRNRVIDKTMKIATFCLILSCMFASRLSVHADFVEDPESFRKVTASVRNKCIAETQTTIEDVENTEYGQFLDDERLKCYFKCVLEKFGMMNRKGNMKFDLLRKIIPSVYKDVIDDMIDSCSDVDGKDKCSKAFNFMECMFNANPIAYVSP